jgi:hypothetical protein
MSLLSEGTASSTFPKPLPAWLRSLLFLLFGFALVAPLFVTLELLGAVRPWRHLFDEVERLAGPTILRDLAQPAPR